MKDTIMESPSMASFGDEMDKTVKFNTRDKKFIKGLNKIKREQAKFSTKQVSPYEHWAEEKSEE